ncbi:methylmalonyl Co-A mutase-associated GTPase MeaB [uncultured Nocardioides sp.]|uniref:methylmalonyl Co-A mutase-associated GTPase MeaB n=1 Tax=uncultured Nocardioides sp. TaxID=198441 RepID=UPI0026200FBA|nr:methylmalonyl Co-A mutase-associated GTPase MeaB [uncultured Nocardioides sp.]
MSGTTRRPGRPGRHGGDAADLVTRARAGEVRAVARLVSWVEDEAPGLPEVARLLAPHTGRAQVIGVTGAPGVGKSTTTNALIAALRAAGRSVGVLAVDPSSPFSGGALLGDRVRMGDHAGDGGVFIRSMAARGHLGGLAWSTPQAVRVLDASGYDVVLVETVGVGQSEVEVAGLADTTLVLLAPGLGDGIQAAKAGILETADVLCVNKADREGADRLVHDLRAAMNLSERHPDDWRPPIQRAVARDGTGMPELVGRLDEHRAWLESSGDLARRRTRRARAEVEAIAVARLRSRWADLSGSADLDDLAAAVAAGDSDPYAAAGVLLADLPDGAGP